MCGRYTLFEAKDLGPRYNLAAKPKFVSKDNYNVAPGQNLPVIVQNNGTRTAEIMKWGFVPVWSKDPAKGFRPINTVSETAFEKPMWRRAVQYQRCLVPSRGFYEWKKVFTPDGKLHHKEPHMIHPKGQPLFSFAGVYSIWKDAEGYPLTTFSIMTTQPNKEMSDIHNRMPVILNPEAEDLWLDPSNDDQQLLAELLKPYEDGALEIYRVSDEVGSPKNNYRSLVEAVS